MKPAYNFMIILLLTFTGGMVSAQDGAIWQEQVYSIIRSVEANNPELEARRRLRDAQGIEARMENNLEDPEVEYNHLWGRPSTSGPTSELTVTQSFDFPTVYARRAKLAEKRAAVYGYEYETYRQQILFEAQALCIRITALRQKKHFLEEAMNDALRVADLVDVRVEAGDASTLDAGKARYEYISAANAFQLNEIDLVESVNRLNTLNGSIPAPLDGASLEEPMMLRPYGEMAGIYENLSPDMLLVLSELDAANQDIRVSRSQGLPKLAVGYKRDTGPGEKLNGVIAGMTIPLFSNRHNVKRAKAGAAYAEAEVRRVRNDMQSYLISLYSRAELLQAASEQYRRILDYTDSVALLRRALDEGHISIIDYYAQLQPVYEGSLTMIDVMEEYHLICAQINAVFL